MEKKNIVYSCDNNYVEQTIVSMVSLLKYNIYSIKFWIISDEILNINKEKILNHVKRDDVDIEFLELNELLNDVCIKEGSRHPKTIYSKLFLENIIKSDKVLYLDSDTVTCGSLEALWERNMENEIAAGVLMPYSYKKKKKMGVSSGLEYICDGVVLLNLALWRQEEIGSQCKEYIKKYNGVPPVMSEGTLNYICQNRLGILMPEYNLMPFMLEYTASEIATLFDVNNYYNNNSLENAKNNPRIIHFIKELYNRPWFEPCDHPYKSFYREQYIDIFGETNFTNKPLEQHTKVTRLLRKRLPFFLFSILYHTRERFRKKV